MKLIYPLGDSITRGLAIDTDQWGYRDHLQALLGVGIYDFVGECVGGLDKLAYDDDHGGVSGERTDQIAARAATSIPSYMAGADNTSKILVHAGANDITQNYGTGTLDEKLDSYVSNVRTIIDIAHIYNPEIQMFVALITPIDDVIYGPIVQAYNAKLDVMLTNYVKSNLYAVDMHSTFLAVPSWDTQLMGNTAHPNDAGYQVMATAWYNAITTAIPRKFFQVPGAGSVTQINGAGTVY